MSKLAEQLKQGAGQAWESLAEGWRELSARASGALTRFRLGASSQQDEANQPAWLQSVRWGLMAADVFDDGDRLVVRIEAPGLHRDDFHIDLHEDVLTVWGEKRFDRSVDQGSYRVAQCAYGNFRRDVALPAAVDADRVKASYRDGVLRVEMPKIEPAHPRRIAVHGG